MTTGEKIKMLRTEKNMTQAELGEKIGVKFAAINKYETGVVVNLKRSTIQKLADALDTTPAFLMGWDDNLEPLAPVKERAYINVYGSIPAGVPIEAIPDILEQIDIPLEWTRGGQQYIGLKVKGDSMYPKYLDGDTVIIRLQPDCESGQDCAVYVNGYDATLKKVRKMPYGIMLQPLNPDYEPREYPFEGGECDVKVLGIVVELRRAI